ncbi:MAG: hypothetical protein A3E78_11795 [Alphaproteobacteria bacterium RIFCSPHIGHO2_12_FULL_63_12]|nr:MAG: hypothetical protein A3E78_11795 [Alphaproteobacteria bacterium RIFCSPHIGHO2_12_FULL_63_12]
MTTRQERDRFEVRLPSGEIVARYPNRRLAIDRARQEARKRGGEVELFDSLATPGSVETWLVPASGTVQAVELRTVEQAS